MRDLLAKQDFFRIILMVACSAYLFQRIYLKTKMLLEKEIGFAEIAADSGEMKFPSITFCPTAMAQTSHEYYEVANITADYHNLPRIEDILIKVHQKININK